MIDPDRTIQEALNSHMLPGYDWYFSAVTMLGEAYLWLIILAGCLFIVRWRKVAAVLIIIILFSMAVNEDIKDIVRRTRPGGVVVRGYFTNFSYSFPSGHTQIAFAIATALSVFIGRRYAVITYLLAAAVGMSRIYLGVHYFTDVVGGATAGIAIGGLAIYGMYRYGLIEKAGLLQPIAGALHLDRKDALEEKGAIKKGIMLLFAGFVCSLSLMLIGQYALSLAAMSLIYFALLALPGFGRRVPAK